jgi:putative membrane protein
VFDVGSEPDPRFTLANERTLLAWLRTALAFVAAGIGAAAFTELAGASAALRVAGVTASVVGGLAALTAIPRWAKVERAMRLLEPLPSPLLSLALVASVVLVAGVGALFALR